MKAKKQKKEDLTNGEVNKKVAENEVIEIPEHEEGEEEEFTYKSKFISDFKIAEMIYSKITKKGAFLEYSKITKKVKEIEEIKDGERIIVPDIKGKLIDNNIIKIPSGSEDYVDTMFSINITLLMIFPYNIFK